MLDNRDQIFEQLMRIVSLGLELPSSQVVDYPVNSSEIKPDNFPFVSLIEGGDRVIRELTSTIDIELDIFVRIFVKSDYDHGRGARPLSVGRNLYDRLVSVIESNPQLNNTCIIAGCRTGDPPIQWPLKNEVHIYDRLLTVRYRRDITY